MMEILVFVKSDEESSKEKLIGIHLIGKKISRGKMKICEVNKLVKVRCISSNRHKICSKFYRRDNRYIFTSKV